MSKIKNIVEKKCPYCGSLDVYEIMDTDEDHDTLIEKVTCDGCGSVYRAFYEKKLISIEEWSKNEDE